MFIPATAERDRERKGERDHSSTWAPSSLSRSLVYQNKQVCCLLLLLLLLCLYNNTFYLFLFCMWVYVDLLQLVAVGQC